MSRVKDEKYSFPSSTYISMLELVGLSGTGVVWVGVVDLKISWQELCCVDRCQDW